MKIKNLLLISGISLSLYIFAIIFIKISPEFNLIWISFLFWILAIILLPSFILFKNIQSTNHLKIFFSKLKGNEWPLIILIIISIIFSFIFLKDYPFVALGDEVRDGGLNALQIATGQIKNIFDYGRYESHGLIIPTVSSFFYYIFHSSVLTYRVPSAIISVISIILVYATVRMFLNNRAAFFAGLTLITSHFFLFYMRTEIVIAFTAILTALIIFSLGLYKKYNRLEIYALLGLALGFSSGFHASARTIVFIALLIIFISEIFKLIKEKDLKKQLTGAGFLILFYIIGFGPKILFTTPEIFFHTRTISAINQSASSFSDQGSGVNINQITEQYLNSFRMFFDVPLVTIPFHYQSSEILFPFVIGIFIFFGIIMAFKFKKNNFFKYLIIYFLLIPLINSSLTDCYQCNYRLVPMIVVSSIFSGLGIEGIISIIKRYSSRLVPTITVISICIYLLYEGFIFFNNELGSKGKTNQDYLSMHVIYLIKNNVEFKNAHSICLNVSPYNYTYLNLMHIQEQYQYFLPKKYFYVIENEKVKDDTFFIYSNCNSTSDAIKFSEYKICSQKNKFKCLSSKNYLLYINLGKNDEIINKPVAEGYNYFIIPPNASLIP